jgi:proliferating cell nuclear antigen
MELTMEARIRADILRDMVGAISVVSNNVRLVFNADHLTVESADGDHVSMVTLSLDKSAFISYEPMKDERICVSLSKVKEILGLANSGDELQLTTKDSKLIIKLGRLSRRMPMLLESSLEIPKVPNFVPKCSVGISVENFGRVLKACESVHDVVRFIVGHKAFVVRAEGNTDDVEGVYPRDILKSLKEDKNPVKSDYALQLLLEVMRGVPGHVEDITIEFSSDYPARLLFEFAKGAGKVSYLLAPRIG